jgi:hypothetical protein
MFFIIPNHLLLEIIVWNDFPENFESVNDSTIFPKGFSIERRWLEESHIQEQRGSTFIFQINGKYHSLHDKPAIQSGSDCHCCGWYHNDVLDREGDKPAIILGNGTRLWYKKGIDHRDENKPARVFAGGCRQWFVHGRLIRSEIKP